MFITLRDGTDFLQCILTGNLCQTYNAVMLTTESTVRIFGVLEVVPIGEECAGGHELKADYWDRIGAQRRSRLPAQCREQPRRASGQQAHHD